VTVRTITANARTTANLNARLSGSCVSYFTLASTRAKHDLKRPRRLGSAGDWEGYHENSVRRLNVRRFDRDWFRSMGGRTHQSARPLDRSGDRTFPTHDEREGPPYCGGLRPRLRIPSLSVGRIIATRTLVTSAEGQWMGDAAGPRTTVTLCRGDRFRATRNPQRFYGSTDVRRYIVE
jgi:hypothetical protein